MKKTTRFFIILMMISLLLAGMAVVANAAASHRSPTIKTIVATQDYVNLKWSGIKKAQSYSVYKKVGDNPYQNIATVTSGTKSFTDSDITVGTTYKYRIAAKTSKGKLRYSKVKQITPKYIQPCALTTLSNRYDSVRKYSTISWKNSKSGYYYYVFRKTGGGDYSLIATVKGANGSQSYTDTNIKDGTDYTYTVRTVQKLKTKKRNKTNVSYWADYDKEGITTISQKVELDADPANFENLHTTVKWTPVEKATHYYVYREKEFSGTFKLLGKVDKDTTQFTDVYSTSIDKSDSILFSEHFVDPARNPFHYTVRAVAEHNGKLSYGDYYIHGVFALAQPQIISAEGSGNKYSVKFCEVYGGQKYEIWSASKSGDKYTWHKLKTVNPKNANSGAMANRLQTVTVTKHSGDTYLTVKALSTMKGKAVESTFERGFTVANKGKLKGKKVLFYGDSITYGSGYSGKYAYPIRVQQLSGCDYYNPSIPGATYTQGTPERMALHPSTKRDRLYDQVCVRIRDGKDVIKSYDDKVNIPTQPSWGRTFDKYDVVVFAAGTNDYLDNAELGDINSEDPHEFRGAINLTMKYIQEASDKRVREGKAPIRIVFLDQFYSDRTYYSRWGQKTNRDTTPNDIGLTLKDYQDAEDALIKKYRSGYVIEPKLPDDSGDGEGDDNVNPDAVQPAEAEPQEPADASVTNADDTPAAADGEEPAAVVGEEPAGEGGEEPVVDEPGTEEPGTEEPGTEEPGEPDEGVVCNMSIFTMSTRDIINGDTCPYLELDNLHLSRIGSNLVGNKLADFLMNKVY